MLTPPARPVRYTVRYTMRWRPWTLGERSKGARANRGAAQPWVRVTRRTLLSCP